MPTKSKSTIWTRRLGAYLKDLRGERPLEEFTSAVGRSAATISRIERGEVSVALRTVRRLLDAYEAQPTAREAALRLARQALQRGVFHEYADVLPEQFDEYGELEAMASVISNYEQALVPGLAQTADYGRAVLRSGRLEDNEENIERLLEARASRQEILTGKNAPRVWLVMDESAIRRPVGDREVMRAQLQRLLELNEMQHVKVQVVPLSVGPHASTSMCYVILDFDEYEPVVYAELLRTSVYVESEAGISTYRLAFDDARAMALNPADSSSLISAAQKDL